MHVRISFWSMLGAVWRFEQRTFYIGSIESQTHFGMPKGVKNEFDPQ